MSFDPNVIDDLGAKLYSTLPPIIAELIANAYDARATKVEIILDENDPNNKTITVRDDGVGMNFSDINSHYLVVGRKKRDGKSDGTDVYEERAPIGKKGLGKLSFFGIAETAIITTVKSGKKIEFVMDLDKIHSSLGKYEPEFKEQATSERDGTLIVLTRINRKTGFDANALAKSISNYFILDDDFNVLIKKADDKQFIEVDNSLRYKHKDRNPEYSWTFPDTALRKEIKQFSFSSSIRGKIILFDKPVRPNLRGVTLFARKKLVNLPEFFPVQGSSFFYQYLTGWLEVDFVDDLRPDVISTNRSSLAWNDPSLDELKGFLEEVIKLIHREWRQLETEKARKSLSDNLGVDTDSWRESNKNNKIITKNIDKLVPLLDDPEKIPQSDLVKMFDIVHSLAPEHADFTLWRNLNKTLKENEIVKEKFFAGKYLEAAREAVQLYETEVQTVAGSEEIGQALMGEVFGADSSKPISVTDKSTESKRNIDEGQKFLSMGVMTGFKNPAVSHTSLTEGLRNGNFTDRDCLDILSTISYLFNRLERRTSPKQ